jgi:hypothetical protein
VIAQAVGSPDRSRPWASLQSLNEEKMTMKPATLGVVALTTVLSLFSAPPAQAVPLLSGLGGAFGYGELAMSPNDDGSSNRLDLPFEINFFGQTFNSFFINNNGNVTFQSALGTFTPNPFPVTNQPMIAPWWADVDTSGGNTLQPGSNNVYVAAPNPDTVVVTWNAVGYFPSQNDKINDFQLVLRNRPDTGAGNFDFDFRYNLLQWTTGGASGGVAGLGGTPAQAGYDNGQGTAFYTLPGSRTNDVLDLVNTSNGLWTFAVRNGLAPGSEPSNPLMPVVVDGAFTFNFNVVLNQRVWVDPLIATGYDYVLADGSPDFASLIINDAFGDGLYDLWLWDGTNYVDSGIDLQEDQEFFFAPGTRRFSIRGIETSAELDPTDPNAFIVGLTFAQAGVVNLTQTPITVFVDPGTPGSVPEPATAWLAVGALVLVARKKLLPGRKLPVSAEG